MIESARDQRPPRRRHFDRPARTPFMAHTRISGLANRSPQTPDNALSYNRNWLAIHPSTVTSHTCESSLFSLSSVTVSSRRELHKTCFIFFKFSKHYIYAVAYVCSFVQKEKQLSFLPFLRINKIEIIYSSETVNELLKFN